MHMETCEDTQEQPWELVDNVELWDTTNKETIPLPLSLQWIYKVSWSAMFLPFLASTWVAIRLVHGRITYWTIGLRSQRFTVGVVIHSWDFNELVINWFIFFSWSCMVKASNSVCSFKKEQKLALTPN